MKRRSFLIETLFSAQSLESIVSLLVIGSEKYILFIRRPKKDVGKVLCFWFSHFPVLITVMLQDVFIVRLFVILIKVDDDSH